MYKTIVNPKPVGAPVMTLGQDSELITIAVKFTTAKGVTYGDFMHFPMTEIPDLIKKLNGCLKKK